MEAPFDGLLVQFDSVTESFSLTSSQTGNLLKNRQSAVAYRLQRGKPLRSLFTRNGKKKFRTSKFRSGIAFIEGLSHLYNFVPFIETGREGLNCNQRISVCKFRPETYSDVTNFSAGMTPNAGEQSTHNKRSILLRTVLAHCPYFLSFMRLTRKTLPFTFTCSVFRRCR